MKFPFLSLPFFLFFFCFEIIFVFCFFFSFFVMVFFAPNVVQSCHRDKKGNKKSLFDLILQPLSSLIYTSFSNYFSVWYGIANIFCFCSFYCLYCLIFIVFVFMFSKKKKHKKYIVVQKLFLKCLPYHPLHCHQVFCLEFFLRFILRH